MRAENEDETTLARVQSKYQKIRLSKLDTGEYALYLDENIQFVSGIDESVYHGVLGSLPAKMLHGAPGEVLILGGGDGLVARNLLRHPNVTGITMVELDPEMVKFSSTHPVMRGLNQDSFRNPRLQVITDDARNYLSGPARGRFKIGIVDFPDPTVPELEDLYSEELYRKLMGQLCRDPIVAVQSSNAYSTTEGLVAENLEPATMTRVVPVRFKGHWMLDGVVSFAGAGLPEGEAKVSPRYRADLEENLFAEFLF